MTLVYYEDDKLKQILEEPCADCEHKLSYHSFTEGMEYTTNRHYLWVTNCVFCGCKKFKEAKNDGT